VTQALDIAPARVATFPVVEVFGPTVQGEGPEAGQPCYFVRFGGCDWRCTWCDSMHAVDPAQVRQASRLSVTDILARLDALPAGPDLVVLSGGNPALLQLGELVDELQSASKRVAVETQGSLWRDWLRHVDRLVLSPKPPSSGMATSEHYDQLSLFIHHLLIAGRDNAVLKVVVFDEDDLDWAQDLHAVHSELPLYLSAGTDVGLAEDETLTRLRERFRWLCEAASARPALAAARVLPQLHVVAWGTAKGV
jgi:7-carboxy-7-deazaguanine synthase